MTTEFFSGFANAVSLQRETAFNQASAEPAFNLVGKIKLGQSAEFVNKGRKINVWRIASQTSSAGKFFQGSIELELGFNEVIKLLLAGFFDVISEQAVSDGLPGEVLFGDGGALFGDGGELSGTGETLKQYELRPAKLSAIGSFKLAIQYPSQTEPSGLTGDGGELIGDGGPLMSADEQNTVLFSGVVIDYLRFDIRRNQVPKLAIQFKAASRRKVASPAFNDIQNKDLIRAHHLGASAKIDEQSLNLTEISLTFTQRKAPRQFGTDLAPARFSLDPFEMDGQLVEYDGPQAKLPDAILDQNEHKIFVSLTDVAGGPRKLEFTWPRVNFNNALPDMVNREDLICRASFNGMEYPEQSEDGPKIILVV